MEKKKKKTLGKLVSKQESTYEINVDTNGISITESHCICYSIFPLYNYKIFNGFKRL